MQLARVIGVVVSTLKHSSMEGHKLLLVQPLMADGRSGDGYPMVAVDGVGAGTGQNVMITSDGRGARELMDTAITPVRWTISGIEDA